MPSRKEKATRCSKCGRPFRAGENAMIESWGTVSKIDAEGRRGLNSWLTYQASNCTLPGDKKHHCWIRHGEVPNLTVDKAGVTCAAGAGSIQAGDYHGFLRNGEFEP
jgi:hypothetical protein